jgi:Zn-dependent protease
MTFTALLFDTGAVEIARIALVVGFIILSLSVHEWAHAFAAHKLGDDTAKSLGRMTPNPIVHIDPLMTIAIPALLLILTNGQFVFGGAKPVPVDPRNFRHPHAANAIVAVAGPLSNFALAFVFLFANELATSELGYRQSELLPWVLTMSAVANVVLGVFNLLPIPPLDGSRVVNWLLPPAARATYASLETFGIFIVLALLHFTGVGNALGQTGGEILHWMSRGVDQFMDLVGLR